MTVYAAPEQLRNRFQQGDVDEFALRTDEELEQALLSASYEIDSYRGTTIISAAGELILADKCLTLARMIANQDQALDITHPMIREATAVRDWLQLWSKKVVNLPTEMTQEQVKAIDTSTRKMVYDSVFDGQYES